jgi:hypothetical protein
VPLPLPCVEEPLPPLLSPPPTGEHGQPLLAQISTGCTLLELPPLVLMAYRRLIVLSSKEVVTERCTAAPPLSRCVGRLAKDERLRKRIIFQARDKLWQELANPTRVWNAWCDLFHFLET